MELKFCQLKGIVLLHSREDSFFEHNSCMEAKFTVIPEQQYSEQDHRVVQMFLQSPKNFKCAHFSQQTSTAT
jgi:hypothetical protein